MTSDPEVEEIALYHQGQLDRLLHDPELRRSEAARSSIKTALKSMEPGLLGRWTVARRATKVLAMATAHRQSEPGPTVRWRIASLVESLAILRLISIKGGTTFRSDNFDELRRKVCKAVGIR
jgi:hypothetical protein